VGVAKFEVDEICSSLDMVILTCRLAQLMESGLCAMVMSFAKASS
jgi:hypothetical protein